MKYYGDAPGHSMQMHEDPALQATLVRIIEDEQITVAIETGTYKGLGSTRMLAEAFVVSAPVFSRPLVHTIEVNRGYVVEARKNLKAYPFVKVYWGRSVDFGLASAVLQTDPVLRNPENHPTIWCDHRDQENLAAYYRAEMGGPTERPYPPDWTGEDLLRKLLIEHRDRHPLVVLDSAGGIGWLEFNIMRMAMGARPYHVLLDDVQHLKHFRSLAYMKEGNGFRILLESGKAALAVHE